MKKLLLILLAGLPVVSFADYGARGSANTLSTSAQAESLATENRMNRMATDPYLQTNTSNSVYPAQKATAIQTERSVRLNRMSEYPNAYSTYPNGVRPVSRVGAAAQDVVSGTERVLEAPLNLIKDEPYYVNQPYGSRPVSRVRATAQDAVDGTETILEAPLNLIP